MNHPNHPSVVLESAALVGWISPSLLIAVSSSCSIVGL